MKVCLDVSAAAAERGGMGRYSARLAEALAALPGVELTLLYHGAGAARLSPALAALPARPIALGSKPWRAGVALAHLLGRPMDRWIGPCDLFHATDHLLPPLRHAPTVFTVHDLAFLTQPETHLRSNRAFLGWLMPRFVRAATRVIADSEATRRDVLRHYGVAPDKVRTVYLGVEPSFTPPEPARALEIVRMRQRLVEPYVLFVGTLEPRKNLPGLLAAYRRLVQERGAAAPWLAIAGAPGWGYDEVYRLVRGWGLTDRVSFLGRVPDADLPPLYASAAAFAYPSLYEGFGLPPLEALACGAPVVCSNRSSLPEVVGDAALLVDPTNPGAIANALGRLLDDAALRADLRARGLARAARFTWQRTAAETVQVYEEARAVWHAEHGDDAPAP
jgi:glycosyltransferase involved in cell wall biosynthesis